MSSYIPSLHKVAFETHVSGPRVQIVGSKEILTLIGIAFWSMPVHMKKKRCVFQEQWSAGTYALNLHASPRIVCAQKYPRLHPASKILTSIVTLRKTRLLRDLVRMRNNTLPCYCVSRSCYDLLPFELYATLRMLRQGTFTYHQCMYDRHHKSRRNIITCSIQLSCTSWIDTARLWNSKCDKLM